MYSYNPLIAIIPIPQTTPSLHPSHSSFHSAAAAAAASTPPANPKANTTLLLVHSPPPPPPPPALHHHPDAAPAPAIQPSPVTEDDPHALINRAKHIARSNAQQRYEQGPGLRRSPSLLHLPESDPRKKKARKTESAYVSRFNQEEYVRQLETTLLAETTLLCHLRTRRSIEKQHNNLLKAHIQAFRSTTTTTTTTVAQATLPPSPPQPPLPLPDPANSLTSSPAAVTSAPSPVNHRPLHSQSHHQLPTDGEITAAATAATAATAAATAIGKGIAETMDRPSRPTSDHLLRPPTPLAANDLALDDAFYAFDQGDPSYQDPNNCLLSLGEDLSSLISILPVETAVSQPDILGTVATAESLRFSDDHHEEEPSQSSDAHTLEDQVVVIDDQFGSTESECANFYFEHPPVPPIIPEHLDNGQAPQLSWDAPSLEELEALSGNARTTATFTLDSCLVELGSQLNEVDWLSQDPAMEIVQAVNRSKSWGPLDSWCSGAESMMEHNVGQALEDGHSLPDYGFATRTSPVENVDQVPIAADMVAEEEPGTNWYNHLAETFKLADVNHDLRRPPGRTERFEKGDMTSAA